MSDRTPTEQEVRERFIDGFPMDTWIESRTTVGAEFDRWLVEHDRQVKAEALREAAAILRGKRVLWQGDRGVRVCENYDAWDGRGDFPGLQDWLDQRANRIEAEVDEMNLLDAINALRNHDGDPRAGSGSADPTQRNNEHTEGDDQ